MKKYKIYFDPMSGTEQEDKRNILINKYKVPPTIGQIIPAHGHSRTINKIDEYTDEYKPNKRKAK